MLNRGILFGCILFAASAVAVSVSAQAQKAQQKNFDTRIDYKLTGAPMPRLKLLVYHDTAKGGAAVANEDKPKAKKHRRNSKGLSQADTNYITEKDLDNGYNYMVMLFNPTCGHCQDMTKVIEKNLGVFSKTNLLFIATPMMSQYLPDFATQVHVSEYPSFHVGTDSSGFVDNLFLYQMLPQINIYDADRKLVKIFTGDVSIDSLKKYIE